MADTPGAPNLTEDPQEDPWKEVYQDAQQRAEAKQSVPQTKLGTTRKQIAPGVEVTAFETSAAYLAHLHQRLAKLKERSSVVKPVVRPAARSKQDHFLSMISKNMDDVEIYDPFDDSTTTAFGQTSDTPTTSQHSQANSSTAAQQQESKFEAIDTLPLLSEVEAALVAARLQPSQTHESTGVSGAVQSSSQAKPLKTSSNDNKVQVNCELSVDQDGLPISGQETSKARIKESDTDLPNNVKPE